MQTCAKKTVSALLRPSLPTCTLPVGCPAWLLRRWCCSTNGSGNPDPTVVSEDGKKIHHRWVFFWDYTAKIINNKWKWKTRVPQWDNYPCNPGITSSFCFKIQSQSVQPIRIQIELWKPIKMFSCLGAFGYLRKICGYDHNLEWHDLMTLEIDIH